MKIKIPNEFIQEAKALTDGLTENYQRLNRFKEHFLEYAEINALTEEDVDPEHLNVIVNLEDIVDRFREL